MSTIIRGTSVVPGNGKRDSTIEICAKTVNEIIEKIDIDKRDIDMIINISMNRDNNIVEPAIATLIQKKARVNVNPTRKHLFEKKSTLSFDLMHGANGFLCATNVIDSFFKSGMMKNAIIVASEIHPSGEKLDDFPFQPYGSAIYLQQSKKNEKGFKSFEFNVSKTGPEGFILYSNPKKDIKNSRKRIEIDLEENYYERLEMFTFQAVSDYIKKNEIDLFKVKHVITSTPTKRFGKNLADSLGFDKKKHVDIFPKYGDTFTSAPIIGYHEGIKQEIIKDNDQTLFISGGSGPSCAIGLYQN